MKPLPLNISNDTLNIIIGIATLIIGLTAFGIEFGENKYFKFAKSLWFRIPTLVIFSLVIIWATVIKDKNNDVRNSNDLRERDSVNQIDYNKSLSKASAATSTANAETMAKYYLKYDSAQHKIEKIVKDSNNKKTYVVSPIKPDIEITDIKYISFRNDSLVFSSVIICHNAPASKVNIQLSTIYLKNGIYNALTKLAPFASKDLRFSTNTKWGVTGPVAVNFKERNLYRIYFRFSGSYYFEDKPYRIDQIQFFDFTNQTYGIPGNIEDLRNMFAKY